MVCVPCIILPFVLAVYIKFIQPIVLRFVPDRWKIWFDSWLYPTCPLNIQTNQTNEKKTDQKQDGNEEKKEL
jgi:hypothetical protein